ncbi:hypothetical protein [Paradevosia shaoguanensis]|uniref:Uncharacterized protein n=1 Tax=Paradevosia shaoguanensis TaxID=1335043 RepID=A0AA41QQ96_9HYPH|nr:hypothetical protein [Paradevosia shaoguanensis]MCF1744222.1 hypothetical protein [Paradevosia shaoguanensis]MCI0128705.1 hypothetical protein [Paradevosia shaoguanensis]
MGGDTNHCGLKCLRPRGPISASLVARAEYGLDFEGRVTSLDDLHRLGEDAIDRTDRPIAQGMVSGGKHDQAPPD